MSIPKIIHSCWFGGNPKPPLVNHCQQTWHSGVLDGYDFMEWNEDNIGLQSDYLDFLKRKKIWAYCADIARYWALYHHGGVYLDSDCEVIRPPEHYLEKEAVLTLGYEGLVLIHVIMARPRHPFIKTVLDFMLETKQLHHLNAMVQTQYLLRRHIDEHGAPPVHFAHSDVFHPFNPKDYRSEARFRGPLSPATRVVHVSMASWVPQIRNEIDKKGGNKLTGALSRKAARLRKRLAIAKLSKKYPGIDQYRPISADFLPIEEKEGGFPPSSPKESEE